MKALLFAGLLFGSLSLCAAESGRVPPRWSLADGGTRIVWNVRDDKRLPHRDMLEMSGLQASLVLSYEIDAARKPKLNRFVLWPQYRTQPNDTHATCYYEIGRAHV